MHGFRPLGPLGFSSSQHRQTPELLLQKSHASVRMKFRPSGAKDRGRTLFNNAPVTSISDTQYKGWSSTKISRKGFQNSTRKMAQRSANHFEPDSWSTEVWTSLRVSGRYTHQVSGTRVSARKKAQGARRWRGNLRTGVPRSQKTVHIRNRRGLRCGFLKF